MKTNGAAEVEDETAVMLKFANGAVGTMTCSWLAHGRKHHLEFEVNAERGTLLFDSERLNELQIALGDDDEKQQGFRRIYVGQPHPYGSSFELKSGMGIGIKESFIIQCYELVRGVVEGRRVSPDFYDGWCVDEIIEKSYASVRSGRWEKVGRLQAPDAR